MDPFSRSKRNRGFLEILCVILCIIIFLIFLAVMEGAPFKDIPIKFANSFYSPEYNLIFVGTLAGINANLSILFLIIFSSLSLKLFRGAKKNRNFSADHSIPASCFAAIIILFFLAAAQTVNFTRYLRHQSQAVSHKTASEKKTMLFGDIYTFSQFCHKRLPGKHKARLITDINVHDTTGANTHIALAYNLFPITIQYNPRQKLIMPDYTTDDPALDPIEVLIVYQKKDPKNSVPQGFHIVGYFDKNSLLAVKKRKL